jgi:hypothetical protein
VPEIAPGEQLPVHPFMERRLSNMLQADLQNTKNLTPAASGTIVPLEKLNSPDISPSASRNMLHRNNAIDMNTPRNRRWSRQSGNIAVFAKLVSENQETEQATKELENRHYSSVADGRSPHFEFRNKRKPDGRKLEPISKKIMQNTVPKVENT